jgi:hypothetical protein
MRLDMPRFSGMQQADERVEHWLSEYRLDGRSAVRVDGGEER